MRHLPLIFIAFVPLIAFAENLPIKQGKIVLNPNSLSVQKELDKFREPIPYSESSRKVYLRPDKTVVVITRPNFWTALKFHGFKGKMEYFVGNSGIYQVKQVGKNLFIRPSKRFENSNLIVSFGNGTYQILLTQSVSQLDGIVEFYPKKKVDYEKELKRLLSGKGSEYLKLVPFKAGEKYFKVVEINGKTYGVVKR